MHPPSLHSSFFFFNDTATTEIYTLSLHDALPISPAARAARPARYDTPGTGTRARATRTRAARRAPRRPPRRRSEEHTSELQSRLHLVCRLLLEKKKTIARREHHNNSWRGTSQAVL